MKKEDKRSYKMTPTDLGSTEMVFLVLSILESLGYPGFMQLLSVINDPGVIIKIIRLMYGTEIKVPPLQTFIDALDTATYMFSDFFKEVQKNTPAQPKYIREYMNIDQEREKKLLETKAIINKMPLKISVVSVIFFIPLLLLLILGPVLINYLG